MIFFKKLIFFKYQIIATLKKKTFCNSQFHHFNQTSIFITLYSLPGICPYGWVFLPRSCHKILHSDFFTEYYNIAHIFAAFKKCSWRKYTSLEDRIRTITDTQEIGNRHWKEFCLSKSSYNWNYFLMSFYKYTSLEGS